MDQCNHRCHASDPAERRVTFTNDYGLSAYASQVLADDPMIAAFYDQAASQCDDYTTLANWVMGPIKSSIKEQPVNKVHMPVTADQLISLIQMVKKDVLSHSQAEKLIYPKLIDDPHVHPEEVLSKLGLNNEIDKISDVILSTLRAHPSKVEAYKKGKKNLLGMFMGEVMKETEGKANPKKVNELLRAALEDWNEE